MQKLNFSMASKWTYNLYISSNFPSKFSLRERLYFSLQNVGPPFEISESAHAKVPDKWSKLKLTSSKQAEI
jgi:hypothetical protein